MRNPSNSIPKCHKHDFILLPIFSDVMPLHTYSFRHLMCLDSTHPRLRFIHGASRIWRQLLPASHSACSTSHDHRTHSFGDINSQVEVNWRRSPITKKNDATVKLSNTISGNEIPSTVKELFTLNRGSVESI